MSQHHSRRRRPALLASVLLAGVMGGLAEPAAAGGKPLVNYSGLGTHQPVAGGVAVTGTGSGDPFDGAFLGELVAADGSLPVPGDCEPATATLRIDGPRSQYLVLEPDEGAGSVCGEWTDAVHRVTHVFTGRYVVGAAARRRFVGTDGWYEVRLADNGVAGVTAVDT